jgi:hypothetical protein
MYGFIQPATLFLLINVATVFGQNIGYDPQYNGTGNGCKPGGSCYYVDYVNGSDSNSGLSKTAAWKSVPGMACATGNSAAHSVGQTDQFILKGGDTWPAWCFPWTIGSGGAGVANSSGYPGVYVGYDPTWNTGAVLSVRVVDPGSCAAGTTLSVAISGGGGTGATATAQVETDPYAAGDLEYVTVTGGGSGYTSNPGVIFTATSGSCGKLPTAYADIYSPIMNGSGTTYGTSTAVPLMFTFTPAYGTVDHLEMAHFLWYSGATYSGGSPALMGGWGPNQEIRNLYVHDFGIAGAANSATLVGARNAAQSAAFQGAGAGSLSLLTNSIFNNYESEARGCANGYTGSCIQNTAIFDEQRVTNNVINGWRAGIYTTANATSGYLVAGNKIWAILCDANTQHPDAVYLMGGSIVYNNVLRDIFNGTAAFYIETSDGSVPAKGMTTYLFNNVMFGIGTNGSGTSTPPIGWSSEFVSSSATSFSTSPDLRAFNNTFFSNAGDSNCINAGQWFGNSPALSSSFPFTIYNNHCISDQSQGHWFASNSAGNGYGVWNGLASPNATATENSIDATAVVQSPGVANGQGYSSSNNFAPTSSSNATVTFSGTNLASLCPTSVGGVSLAPLCSDIKGNPRPGTGAWQAGAYQSGALGNGPPAAPSSIVASVR